MKWQIIIILVVCMVFSSSTYADFGYTNPFLPKLLPITTTTIVTSINGSSNASCSCINGTNGINGTSVNYTVLNETGYVGFWNFTNWVNASGYIIPHIDYNSSGYIINWNQTGFIINQTYGYVPYSNASYITTNNFSNWVNASGLILNWTYDSTTYYPSNVTTLGGTNTTGNVNLTYWYDGLYYNITEGAGATPVLDVYMNYTGVTDFSQWVLREYYLGSSSHNLQFEIYDYDTSTWESYFSVVGQTGMTWLTIPVLDTIDHISSGIVQTRIRHIETGVSSHRLYIDVSWLLEGNNIGASTNLEGYSKYSFGYNNFSGYGNFSTSGYIYATNINTSSYYPLTNPFGFVNESNFSNWVNESGLILNWSSMFGGGFALHGDVNGNVSLLQGEINGNVSDINTKITNNISYMITNDTRLAGNITALLQNDTWLKGNITALNASGYIINWNSTGYIQNWNSSGYIINWNQTGFIINQTSGYLAKSGGNMTGNINMSGNNITGITSLITYNNSFGIFMNGTCIVIGDLTYKTSC